MASGSREQAIRFAVGSADDARSNVWRMWVQGDDVYVGVREWLKAYKISLHASGVWRIAWVKDLERERPNEDRLIFRWKRPDKFAPGWTLALGIIVSTIEPPRPLPPTTIRDAAPIHWCCPALSGKKDLYAVFLSNSERSALEIVRPTDELIADFTKMSGERVWLLRRSFDDLTEIEEAKIREVMNGIKMHLRAGSRPEDARGRAVQIVWPDVPSSESPPTLFDISLGLDNVVVDESD